MSRLQGWAGLDHDVSPPESVGLRTDHHGHPADQIRRKSLLRSILDWRLDLAGDGGPVVNAAYLRGRPPK
jgi:hypothetical protein